MIENEKNKRKPTVRKTQKQKSKKPVEKTEETSDSDASLQLVHDTDDDISHDENNSSATEEDNCGKAKEFVKFDGSQNQNNRGVPLPPVLKLYLALRFFATGSYQRVYGDLVSVSQSLACRVIHEVSEKL
ncbi:hypothetical protein RN001_009075 [Aquatica leii]|uniref:Uncharacterized protein n=1 Tax=Aquatica leii TaxID=1421715 RepID=A0AAN7SFH1_9COLE|nr:hypothetical protein RN001_009075 [Aquatica leii]